MKTGWPLQSRLFVTRNWNGWNLQVPGRHESDAAAAIKTLFDLKVERPPQSGFLPT
jgi:hypothetical protein